MKANLNKRLAYIDTSLGGKTSHISQKPQQYRRDYSTEVLRKQPKDRAKYLHDPKNPLLFTPNAGDKPRIPTIAIARNALQESYVNPYKYRFGRIFWHDDKNNLNGAKRKRRSQIREAITHKFLQALIYHTHIATLIVGYPKDSKYSDKYSNDGFHFYSIRSLAEKAKISFCQAYRACDLLKNYYYIDIIEQKIKMPDGSYKSINPVITINKQLFLDLGVSEQDIQKEIKKHEGKIQLIELHKKRLDYWHKERASKRLVNSKMKEIRKTLNQETIKGNLYDGRIDARDKSPNQESISPKELLPPAYENSDETPPRNYVQRERTTHVRDFTGMGRAELLRSASNASTITRIGSLQTIEKLVAEALRKIKGSG